MSGNVLSNPKKSGVAALSDLNDICVAGITPFTTIDFPGRLAGVFYLQGCPWRCRYCYNTEFWPLPPAGQKIPFEKITSFLESRKNHLDGIVFSGGEPTVHERLPAWMKVVKSMGFEIALHTGGMFPERLETVLPLCDWIGMDIKAPFDVYEKVTRIPGSGDAARRSADRILASGIAYEFRTTFHPALLSEEDVLEMARELSQKGCKRYVLQGFRREHCPDGELCKAVPSDVRISGELRKALRPFFSAFEVRE